MASPLVEPLWASLYFVAEPFRTPALGVAVAQALALGPVTYLSEGETHSSTKTIDTQVDRAWNLWRMQVEGALAPQAASSKQTSDITQGL